MITESRINNMPIALYKANMLSYIVGFSSIGNSYFVPPSKLFYVKLKPTVSLRKITITLDFEGDTRREIEMNISGFAELLRDGADLLLPDGFGYFCILDSASVPEEKSDWIVQVTFSLSGIRHGAIERTPVLHSTADIFVDGNYETPVIIELESNSATASVAGITVSNISGKIVIDSTKCKVTQNGINKFKDTNLTVFPKLQAGINTVEITGNPDVVISYYPIYV